MQFDFFFLNREREREREWWICIVIFFSPRQNYPVDARLKSQSKEISLQSVLKWGNNPTLSQLHRHSWMPSYNHIHEQSFCLRFDIHATRQNHPLSLTHSLLRPIRSDIRCLFHDYYWAIKMIFLERCFMGSNRKKYLIFFNFLSS